MKKGPVFMTHSVYMLM